MPHIESNGIELYYEEQGQGEPLLLIMGFTVSSIGWHWKCGRLCPDLQDDCL